MSLKRIVPVAVLGSCLVLPTLIGTPNAHAGILLSRWASPTGTPANNCTQDDPCDIETAVNDAPASSTVNVLPGVYGSPTPLATALYPPHTTTIRGTDPQNPPLINSAASDYALEINNNPATVRNLQIVSTGSNAALFLASGAVASHLTVTAKSAAYGACSLYGATLTDSVCYDGSADGFAVSASTNGLSGTETNEFDNVTAVATGANSIGISQIASGGVKIATSATDSIFQGTEYDVQLAGGTGSTVAMSVSHSNYRPAKVHTDAATFTNGGGNVKTLAVLRHPKKGDLRERATSPTIDAGVQSLGKTDLANYPRTLGKNTDIGAYEFLPVPTLSRFHVIKITKHSVTATVKVHAGGLPTKALLIARSSGPHHRVLASKKIIAGHSRGSKRVKVTILHLTPGTTYKLNAQASSDGGGSNSAVKTVTTKG